MFVIGATDDAIDYYTLSTAYDTSTATHQADYLRGTYTTAWSLSFNNDGTKLFIVDGDSTDAIYEYSLSTAYDLSNLTLESSRTGLTTYPTGHSFNSDGTKLFLSFNDRTIKEYSLSVGFDLSSTFTLVDTLDISSDLTGGTRGVEFNDDGTKMFVSTEADQKIFQYDLPTGFDLTNAALKGNVSHGLSYMTGFTFKPDGSQLFLARSGFGKIVTYDTASPFELTDVNGEYSGDVINTSSTANYDTDPDSDTLTVTAIRAGSSEGSGTAGSIGSALTGTYGQLTIAANGSYTYVANQDAADALDPGDVVTDTFNYTVSDGQGETDIAVLTITVNGINDTPVAQNDVGVIVEDGTLTVANSANANLSGSYDATGEHSGDVIDTSSSSHTDSDADASASLTVTAIRVGSSEGSGTAGSIGSALTGTYGQLTIAADGSYSYVANQDLADALDVGDSVTDTFNYTLSDGTATDIGVITITILGANDNPTAVNDTGYIKEGGTLTVANSAAASSGTSTGNHTGDMTDNDTDDDASSTATITSISTTALGDAQTTFSSNSETVNGAYGTLTINSNGSYSYVANSNISGLDAGDANITDVFTYIVSDGTATSTATLTINVIASQDLTARNDTGTVNEDATLTVDDGDNLTPVTAASYVIAIA